jgi:hypothetical protein
MDQEGAGQLTVSTTGTANVTGPLGLLTRAQGSTIAITQLATDVWLLSGDAS